jgi:hypothetical protein
LLLRRGLRLEYATLACNVFGSVLALAAAVAARSVALAGFGLDSLIEIAASAVVVWQLKGSDKTRETEALRLIGIAFILLALYIGAQSTYGDASAVSSTSSGVRSSTSTSPGGTVVRSPVLLDGGFAQRRERRDRERLGLRRALLDE